MIEKKIFSFITVKKIVESGRDKRKKVLKDINIEIEKGSFLPPYSVTTAAEKNSYQNI